MPTPLEIVESKRAEIDQRLQSGMCFQFDLLCDDEFAEQVVRELLRMNYAVLPKARELFICGCTLHRGRSAESQYISIKVTRHATLRS